MQKPLLNKNFLSKKIENHTLKITQKQKDIFTRWNTHLQETNKNEEQLQSDFLNDIFGEVLGYTYKRGEVEINLEKEEKTELDGQKPDGILGFFTDESKDIKVIIELKDSRTDLDKKQNRKNDNRTPVEQAFGYTSKYEGGEFVIVSNFKEIRLYRSNYQGKYQAFKIDDLVDSEVKQKEFLFFFCKKNLIGSYKQATSLIKTLIEEDIKREDEIKNKFYKEYKTLREEFVNDILPNNELTIETTIVKTQKLFDRLIFIRFCEDNHFITKPFDKVENAKQLGLNLWDGLKLLFKAIDKGNPPHIHKFNGGLFKEDDIFNDIKISANLLEKLIKFIRFYHFKNDISVHILGHIFEQSISDLEQLKAEKIDQSHDKKQGKRKKDGIFYTPEYITKYIVEEAVGGWLKDRKDELEIDKIEPKEIELHVKKPKNYKNPNQELINKYKQYAEKLKQIKILDPACGSGAFLVEVFHFLEREWLNLSKILVKLGDVEELGLFNYKTVYKSILQNNIYGVDLNSESVQITKLSLWLKTANTTDELTTLDDNIKCGNSLIDDPKVETGTYSYNNKTYSKAFKWKEEFPQVFAGGGFDVVVGNPPYGSELGKVSIRTLDKRYINYIGKTKNSAMYFMYLAKSLLQSNGYFAYIIPKSICYSKGWKIAANLLNECCIKIIDASQAWLDVLLEQIIFISTSDTRNENIINGVALNDVICENNTLISRDIFLNSGVLLCGQNYKEISIINKIISRCRNKYGEFVEISRGLNWQGKSCNNKSLTPIYRGANLYKYYLENSNDFINLKDCKESEYRYIQKPKILNQLAIAHVKNPYPHFYLQSFIDESGDMFVFETISCTFPRFKNMSLKFLLALNNSKLFAWLLYKFIYSNAIRSIRFDKEYIQNIPVPNLLEINQIPFIQKAQAMLDTTKQLNEKTKKFIDYFTGKFKDKLPAGKEFKVTKKFKKWYTLDFADFTKELNKQKIIISSTNEFDFKPLFDREKKDCEELQNQITKTDNEIDKMVYNLYGLNDEEIEIIEE